MLCALGAAWAGCGGSTGREGLPPLAAPPDAAPPDATRPDAVAPDAAAPDAAAMRDADAGVDATQSDVDQGWFDVIIPYADRDLPDVHAPVDSGAVAVDTGAPDAGAPDSTACIPFNNNLPLPDGAVPVGCSATEQKFVDKSVACYTCLINGLCLDDLTFLDMGNECGDLTGNAKSGDRAGFSNTSNCLRAIDCILATSCAMSDPAACYCGTLQGSACQTSTSPGNGACAQTQVEGVDHFLMDPAAVVSPILADKTTASGKADAIFACSVANGCAPVCNQ
jgi:hypothetical protein